MTTMIKFKLPEDRKLDIVVTGTGRSGTGFASKWLTSIGIPTGHEVFYGPWEMPMTLRMLRTRLLFLRGESSWLAAPMLDSEPIKDALLVHQVRHPKKMLESCLRKPNSGAPRYAAYMEHHLPRMTAYEDELSRMACQYVYWNQMVEDSCEGREHYFWRVEDGTDGLLRWLDAKGLVDAEKINPAQVFTNTKWNHKIGPEKFARLEDIDPEVRLALEAQMRRYGYTRWGRDEL